MGARARQVAVIGSLSPTHFRRQATVSGKIEGQIVSLAENGNLVTDLSTDRLRAVPRSDVVSVACDEHITSGIFDAQHKQPEMTLVAVLGSSGSLELEIVGDNAGIMLGVGIGQKVVVKW